MVIEHTIHINKEIGQVFQYFIEIENLVIWMDGLMEIEVAEGEELGIGAVSKQLIQQNGIHLHFQQVITGYQENQLFQAKMTSKKMDIDVSYQFKENKNGTSIYCIQKVKLNTFILRTAKGIVKALMEKTLISDFDQLKNILENE